MGQNNNVLEQNVSVLTDGESEWKTVADEETTNSNFAKITHLNNLLRNAEKEPVLLIKAMKDPENATRSRYVFVYHDTKVSVGEGVGDWTKGEASLQAVIEFFTGNSTGRNRVAATKKTIHIFFAESNLNRYQELYNEVEEIIQDYSTNMYEGYEDLINAATDKALDAYQRRQQLKPEKKTASQRTTSKAKSTASALDTKKKKHSKKNKQNEDVGDSKSLLSADTSTILEFSDHRTVEELTSKNINEFIDLSTLLIDFVVNPYKHLSLFSPPTGSGKTYSFNVVCKVVIHNAHLYNYLNRVFFISDRIKTGRDTRNDLQKLDKKAAEHTLILYKDIDNLRANAELIFSLEKEAPELCRLPGYYALISNLKTLLQIAENDNSNLTKNLDAVVLAEFGTWRKQIRFWLEQNPEYSVLSPAERVRFLVNHKNKNYSVLTQLFPAMWIYEKKFIYMTIQKFLCPIDTLVGERALNLYTSAKMMKRSLVFIDEADTAPDVFLNHIIEQSTSADIDIASVVETMTPHILNYHFAKSFKEDPKIVEMIDALRPIYEDYEKTYNVGSDRVLTVESSAFMYRDNTEVYGPNMKEKYHIYDEDSNTTFIVDEKEINGRPYVVNQDYIKDTTLLKDSVFKIIKRMVEIAVNQNQTEQNLEISSLLHKFGLKEKSTIDAITRAIACRPKTATLEEEGESYFINPGGVQKQEYHNDSHYNVSTVENSMASTPESNLRTMMNRGAYVVLSSATADITSIRNFCLSWDGLRKELYQPAQDAIQKEREYLEGRNEGLDKVKRHIIFTDSEESGLESEFIQRAFNGDEAEGQKFLAFVKQHLQRDGGKENPTDKDRLYYYDIYLREANTLLRLHKTGFFAQLALFKFCPEFYEGGLDYSFRLLLDRVKTIIPDLETFTANSQNIDEKVQFFHKAQQSGQRTVLLTSYSTAEKGVNLQVALPFDAETMLRIGKFNNPNDDSIQVDIDAIFLGPITHILPNSEDFSSSKKTVARTLNTAYIAKKLEYTNELTAEEVKETIKNAMDKKKYPFKSDLLTSKSGIGSVLRTMIQSVGRMFRCNGKRKTLDITIDSSNLRALQNTTYRAEYLGDNFYNKQNCVVKELIDILFSPNLQKKHVVYNIPALDNGRKFTNNLLTKINTPGYGEDKMRAIAEYETIHNMKSFAYEDRTSLSKYVQSLLVNVKTNNFDFSEGYSYETTGVDEFGNTMVGGIADIDAFPRRRVCLDALGLKGFQKEILQRDGFNFDKTSGKFLLSPKGFEMFSGRIGESLIKHWFTYGGLVDLTDNVSFPPELYEVMDFVKEEKDYVIVIDAKYHTVKGSDKDSSRELVAKNCNKLKKVRDFYGKKVIGFVVNARYNETAIGKFEPHKYPYENEKDIELWVVPNIYTANDFDMSVLQQIHQIVRFYK